jgi:hypothetical protein
MTKAEEIKHSLYHDYSWTSKQIDELDLHINDVIEATEQAINYTRCCTELRDEYLQPELDKYKNIKVEQTKGISDM